MTRDGEDNTVRRLTETMGIISKKWHPVIIQRLHEEGPLRFSELQERLEGISAKVLTDSLDDLVGHELVDRTVISESPKQVEYALTADGTELQSVLLSLASWGERYMDPDPTVLVVDDDPRLVSMYAGWLEDEYEIERAYHGEAALKQLSEDVDLVLLDRRMPGLSGEEVLEQIRNWGFDTRVVMLSAVDPDLDLVEMPFDAYLTKPGVKQELRETIADVLTRDSYDELTQEYLALNAKRAVLEAELASTELERDENYQQLLERLAELEAELDDPMEGIGSNERLAAVLEDDQ